MTEPTHVWLVWGCGPWPERTQLVPDQEGDIHPVHEEHPDFALLPISFVREWGQALGSQHWAEILRASETNLDQATRHNPNVYGWKRATGEREP